MHSLVNPPSSSFYHVNRFWEGRKIVSTMYQFARALVTDTYAVMPKQGEGVEKRKKMINAISRYSQ